MKFKVLDLFCGAGGFSYGIDKNDNFKTVLGLDFDQNAINTFNSNIKNAIGVCGDITNKTIKENIIKEAKRLGVNMIIGGPPCQGFSLKGKQLGLEDPRNFLFLEYINILKEIQPEIFVIENVKNLLSASKGYFINKIVKMLTNLGYIINYGSLNAKNFGVPQNRERAIIIGSLSRSIALPTGNNKITTVKEAISDLAYLKSGEGEDETDYINPPTSSYQKLLYGTKLYNHKATNHGDIAIKKLKMIPPEGDKTSIPKRLHGKQKFKTTWSRLKWDEISPTIDTRFDTPSNGRNSHPELHRAITPREAARLQSFPDTFCFLGNKTSICKQIGNAVPPFMAKAIADEIEKSYNKDKRTVEDNFTIYLADSFFHIKELKKEKLIVNHIITDPPYNISKENNFSTLNSPRKGVFFGKWDKDFNLTSWIKDYVKILDKNGSIIIFCSYLYLSYIINELKLCNIDVKDIIIWKKKNPMPRNVDRRYVQDMEFAIWGVKKGAKWVFNKPNNKPYLRSIYKTSTVSGNERTKHPTQKSLKLMEDLIKVHTNIGDVILDPFMGSGTTGVACIKNKRSFIGIENNEEYYQIALERINKAGGLSYDKNKQIIRRNDQSISSWSTNE